MQLQDSDQQKQQLVNEKSQMASELKSLSRDLSKLDQFKKSIMQSIHDEEPVPSLRYRGGASAAYDTSPPTNTYEPTPAAPRAYSPPQPSPPLPAAPAAAAATRRSRRPRPRRPWPRRHRLRAAVRTSTAKTFSGRPICG